MTDVQLLPQGQWPAMPVNRAMTPADHVETVPPTMRAADALRLMSEHRRQELPVVDTGRLVGLPTEAGVMRYFQLRGALGLEASSKTPESSLRT